MYKGMLRGLSTAVLPLLFASVVEAQIFTPTFTSPRLLNEMGIYLSDGPGDLAVEGIWRGGPLGLRVGYVDLAGGALTVGAEIRSPLPITGAPLGLALTAGAQGLLGDVDFVGFQGGLTAGYTFMMPGMAITPYMHPRIGMVKGRGDDWDLEVMADIGSDFEFSNNIVLRLGIVLSDIGSDWGVGVAWRR
ncbi:hypothetical protein BH23GEM9_BH23GEM9_30530 [soil metagenome]